MTPSAPEFAAADWAVVGGYFAMLALTGWYFSRRTQIDTRDYFLAGRRVPGWISSISLMATALSAATFLAVPAFSYGRDLTYTLFLISQLVAAWVVGRYFIPVYYRHNVKTVYELLEERFGASTRQTASWFFLMGRVMSSGARVYIAALATSLILFGDIEPRHLCLAIGVMVIVGILYTLVGGIEAIVWTDAIQAAVFIGAAVASIFFLLGKIPAPVDDVLSALVSPLPGQPDAPGKLKWFTLAGEGFGRADTFTLVTALTGWLLLGIAAYGADQDMAQRVLTCRDAKSGVRAAVAGVALTVPVTMLFLVVGLLLWVFYQRPDLVGLPIEPVEDQRRVYLDFILRHMPVGLKGLMLAGLFAAGLSSFNSALNAMASTFIEDSYRKWRPARAESHYVFAGRLSVAAFGVVLGLFSVGCVFWQQARGDALINFVLGVMIFAYSGLLAVYLTVLFTRRGNAASARAALFTGFGVTLALQIQPWQYLEGGTKWDLADPWQMAAGWAAAMIVCMSGNPHPHTGPHA